MLTHAEGEGEVAVDTKADITLSALVWALRIDVLAHLRYASIRQHTSAYVSIR
jgi:hypothetical protein